MISFVEHKPEQQKLLSLCEKTAYGCKISSLIRSYGFEKGFACFWLDSNSDTVFCQSDGDMIISGTVLDGEETRAFLQVVGSAGVLCAVKNAETIHLPVTQSGDVLKKKLPDGVAERMVPPNVNIREIYMLLEEVGMVTEFEPFYLDLSHKLRHGTALVFCRYQEEALIGCAVVSSISEDAAILSAVAVREDYRRKGIGTELVHEAETALPGKLLYVFREKDANREFYRQLDFSHADTWVYSKL